MLGKKKDYKPFFKPKKKRKKKKIMGKNYRYAKKSILTLTKEYRTGLKSGKGKSYTYKKRRYGK